MVGSSRRPCSIFGPAATPSPPTCACLRHLQALSEAVDVGCLHAVRYMPVPRTGELKTGSGYFWGPVVGTEIISQYCGRNAHCNFVTSYSAAPKFPMHLEVLEAADPHPIWSSNAPYRVVRDSLQCLRRQRIPFIRLGMSWGRERMD